MKRTPMHLVLSAAVLTLCSTVPAARAATIAATDFDGRTVAGATASNLTWTLNGVADPGNLTATHPLFDTGDAQNRFAVDRNIGNEGPWSVDIPLSVLGQDIDLSSVAVDVFIFSNAGDFQTENRPVDLLAELLDSSLVTLASDNETGIYPNNANPPVQPQNVVYDFSGNTLSANTDYFIRLTASNGGSGNNAGIDNLVIDGALVVPPVPEPSTFALLGLAGLGLLRLRTRRR